MSSSRIRWSPGLPSRLEGADEPGEEHVQPEPGARIEVDPAEGRFAFHGGHKFRAGYHFTRHGTGTLLTCTAINVAPAGHRDRAAVRLQFRLGAKPGIGLRGCLRHIGRELGCRAYPGQ